MIVMVSLFDPPDALIVGVVVRVVLSVVDVPVSEAAARSMPVGVLGAVVSMVSESAVDAAEVAPLTDCVAVTDQVPALNVGKSQLV